MRFAFSADQRLLAETVRGLLVAECPPERVRQAWDATGDRRLWDHLADMGVLGALAPEAAGGMGMTELDLVGVLVECGRVAVPDPVVDTAAVAVPMLAECGSDQLGPVVSGTRSVAVGFESEPFVRVDADALLLQHGPEWHLVDVDAVTTVGQRSVDGSRRLARVEWSPDGTTVVAEDAAIGARALDRAIVGDAAELVGLAAHLLDATVAYVLEREQFGRPIGSYQALKHKLADVLLGLDFARPVVARAAYSLAHEDPEQSLHASMAKAYAADAALGAVRHALQCHGAIAYTVEFDLHLFMKRVWCVAAQRGDAAWHRRRIAAAIL